ncbi:hypothetical protein SLEP1_g38843 [Rubroshorea leprosula]|uniref:WRKY domain-containing protein n=1 Tax=Rubroshorea leprosula TaxID=152421 RepID=A0AAV5KYB8_9ROSI|nr:hypothetical protein SLEP1_g38843 [Rubroshorea leprosula]
MEKENDAWFDRFGDEGLVSDLLDDQSPFFMLAQESTDYVQGSSNIEEADTNRLMATTYSGPRVEDVENALSSVTTTEDQNQQLLQQARISLLERGLNGKIENKYTLKIKCCGNGMADDGYKWRKYGQKSIKNSPNPSFSKLACVFSGSVRFSLRSHPCRFTLLTVSPQESLLSAAQSNACISPGHGGLSARLSNLDLILANPTVRRFFCGGAPKKSSQLMFHLCYFLFRKLTNPFFYVKKERTFAYYFECLDVVCENYRPKNKTEIPKSK